MTFDTFRRREWVWLFAIAVIFLALRLPAVHSPYHQDEYKWVQYSHPEITPEGTVPHPPLTELIYAKTLGPLFGDDNFRFIPLVFSFANLLLLFYLAKTISDRKSAFWTIFIFTISFYSVLASLMVDVDGAVMPFFFLIMMIGYFKLTSPPLPPLLVKERGVGGEVPHGNRWFWGVVLIIGAVGGFLVKVSGILPISAIFLDFLIEKGAFSDKKRILKYLGLGVLGLAGLAVVLFAAKFIFPFFNLEYSLGYWKHFAVFADRGWLQTFIQFAKSILYLSPLLILPVFFADKEIFKKTRPFFLFIFVGLFFYLFAFDFSLGALDRYFEFLVIPLCIIGGMVFAKCMNYESRIKNYAFPILISVLIFSIQFFNHYVPPLYPKTEWINRILSLKWNFLYPFSGGSGPLPFYVSFAFIALIWAYCLAFALPALLKTNLRKNALMCLLIFGLIYNTVFLEEYAFGKINGSASKLVKDSVEFINNNSSIKKVIVYNDNGGWNVRETGKYERRMYATPQFESEYKEVLGKFSGYILLINIPRIQENSFYTDYMNSCEVVYNETDKYISGKVLNCSQ